VDVYSARHHDHSPYIQRGSSVREARYDAAVFDTEVAGFSIHQVSWIVDRAAD
jgi:hypothetical protein